MKISTRILALAPVLLMALALAGAALDWQGGASQFAGGFQPSNAPWGGFAGGEVPGT